MTSKNIELLSPAGSMEALKAAIKSGCDAVYLGGAKYGARANAKNFCREELLAAIDYVHLNNKKIYLTANTLIKNSEMQDFLEEISWAYQEGVDAVILQDIGAFMQIKKNFPKLPVHASTQMTIHSLEGALFLEQNGFERVVLSRELSLEEISYITSKLKIEVESFVHGALCYCYSGQCLFSSMLGERSGNRGSCAQPCRLMYSFNKAKGHLLSPKDINTLSILPDIIRAGVTSLKLEGRMKNAHYVALITSIYRKYIDLYLQGEEYNLSSRDLNNISQIYNRGGFTKGYYTSKNGIEMMSIENPKHQGILIGSIHSNNNSNQSILKLSQDIKQGDCIEIRNNSNNISIIAKEDISDMQTLYTDNKKFPPKSQIYKLTSVDLLNSINEALLPENKIKIKFKLKAFLDKPLELQTTYDDYSFSIFSDNVEQSKTAPITREKLEIQLSKTGDELVEIETLDIDMDDNIFIAIKSINEIRRRAIAAVISRLTQEYKREAVNISSFNIPIPSKQNSNKNDIKLHVRINSIKQYSLLKPYKIDYIYLDSNFLDIASIQEICSNKYKNSKIVITLPRITRKSTIEMYKNIIPRYLECKPDGFLAGSVDGYYFLKEQLMENSCKGIEIFLDYSLNIMNNSAIQFWQECGINGCVISTELNSKELEHINANNLQAYIYGHLPVMVTAQCLHKQTFGSCSSSNEFEKLNDRKGYQLKVARNCDQCINTIYNPLPTLLIDKIPQLFRMGFTNYRVEFTDEEDKLINKVLAEISKLRDTDFSSKDKYKSELPIKDYTRGHWQRGVK